MIKSNGAGFHARSVTHAPLTPDYTICDFQQSRIKFVKKKNENSSQNENLIFNQNWNELIPERLVREQNVVSASCKLEIHFRTNLAKLTGSAVRINSKKPMG